MGRDTFPEALCARERAPIGEYAEGGAAKMEGGVELTLCPQTLCPMNTMPLATMPYENEPAERCGVPIPLNHSAR